MPGSSVRSSRSTIVIAPGLFRFLLATVVVVSHLTRIAIGTAAVELFFVLSGFWIYRMFDGKYRLAPYPAMLFIASRLVRLLPVFLLFNATAILLHIIVHDGYVDTLSLVDIVPNVLVIGYASQPALALGPAWSLDIELQFYLLFPLIFACIGTWRRHAWTLALTALALGGGFMSIFLRGDSHNVLPFMGFFLLGVSSAMNRWQPSARLVGASALLSALCLTAVLATPSLRGLFVGRIDDSEYVWHTAMNFGLAVLLTPLALSSVYGRSGRRDRLLGDLSYVVYCSHWLAVMVAAHYLSGLGAVTKAPAVVALLAVTYLVSLAVLIYIDRPISRWRERWIGRVVRSSRSIQQTPALP